MAGDIYNDIIYLGLTNTIKSEKPLCLQSWKKKQILVKINAAKFTGIISLVKGSLYNSYQSNLLGGRFYIKSFMMELDERFLLCQSYTRYKM